MSIKINTASLKEGSQKDEIVTDAKELEISKDIIKSKILIILDLFKSANQIDVQINLKGTFRFLCDRCVDYYEMPINIKFELILSLHSSRDNISNNKEVDYIKFYNPNSKSVDITKDIRDNILLAEPMRKVPDEINGKCSWCGKTEEYWKKFFKEEEE